MRNRNFRFYLVGLGLSVMGFQMTGTAIGWELYDRTSSAFVLGLVGLVQVIPIILFTLPAGQMADRMDRRGILFFTLALRVIFICVLAGLSWSGLSTNLMLGCLFILGISRSFSMPARASLLPQMVPESCFGNAVTWSTSIFQIASVTGPALGGWVMAKTGNAWSVYLLDAALSVVFFITLALLRLSERKRSKEVMTWDSLFAGFRFLKQTPELFGAISLDLFAVLFGGATALLPIYARDILKVGPDGMGWLRAAPFMGAFLMGIYQAHYPPTIRPGVRLLAATAGFGLVTILFGFSSYYLLSFFALVLLGATDSVSMVIRHSMVQMRTPDYLRGRVTAVNGLFISMSNELGEFESGMVAAWMGPVFSVVSGGMGTLLVVGLVAWKLPALRRLQQLGKD